MQHPKINQKVNKIQLKVSSQKRKRLNYGVHSYYKTMKTFNLLYVVPVPDSFD